jgi:Sec-independent protein translocase protein TatA
MESQNISIKDLIKAGHDPEDLIAAFKKNIAEAQAEIQQEAADEDDKLEDARINLIQAFDDYAVALGLVEEDSLTEEKFTDMMELLMILEDEVLLEDDEPPVSIKVSKIDTRDKNPDDIIAEFLKSLH